MLSWSQSSALSAASCSIAGLRIGRTTITNLGFTLIELVISAALMSMILVSAYLCLRAGFTSQQLIESREAVLQNARVALNLMTADLRSAWTLSPEFEFIGMRRRQGKLDADNLDFGTRHYSPRNAREFDFCEVSYFLAPDRESGRLGLWRRRDASRDTEPLSGGTRELIADGLRGLRLEYYDGWDWYDDWGDPQGKKKAQFSNREQYNLKGLPDAVRITLSFSPTPAARHGVTGSPNSPTEATTEAGAESATPPTENTDEEPPMIFQTVVRLNLAAAASRTGTGTSSSSEGNTTPGQSGNPQPGVSNP